MGRLRTLMITDFQGGEAGLSITAVNGDNNALDDDIGVVIEFEDEEEEASDYDQLEKVDLNCERCYEIGELIRCHKMGRTLHKYIHQLPKSQHRRCLLETLNYNSSAIFSVGGSSSRFLDRGRRSFDSANSRHQAFTLAEAAAATPSLDRGKRFDSVSSNNQASSLPTLLNRERKSDRLKLLYAIVQQLQ